MSLLLSRETRSSVARSRAPETKNFFFFFFWIKFNILNDMKKYSGLPSTGLPSRWNESDGVNLFFFLSLFRVGSFQTLHYYFLVYLFITFFYSSWPFFFFFSVYHPVYEHARQIALVQKSVGATWQHLVSLYFVDWRIIIKKKRYANMEKRTLNSYAEGHE